MVAKIFNVITLLIFCSLCNKFASIVAATTNDNDEDYDFIVVGGGTAGGIVSARLSEKFSVLVLETGGKPPEDVYIPRLAVDVSRRPGINFHYRTTRQRDAGLELDGFVAVTAGKMLGGDTAHNGMLWTRGSAASYDEWAEMTGDDSWKYENILKYFKKIENYQGSFPHNGQHGQGGPVDIVEDNFTPGAHIWQQAGQELGYEIKDTNGPQSVGFGPTAYTKKKGRRITTYTAYMEPALEKEGSRLKISEYSTVTKILFKNKKAVGVEYIKDGVLHNAFASKEIILSAGTFVSPVILIKSGIGSKEEVEAAKVAMVTELPAVGLNLMDHPKVDVSFYVNDSKINWKLERNLTSQDEAQYKLDGTGPLSASDQQMEAHILSSRQQTEKCYPDTHPYDWLEGSRPISVTADQSEWPDLLISYTPFGYYPNSIYCTIGNYRPRSRGFLTVNFTASDQNDWPIFDFNFYDDETDLDVMIDGIYFCLKLMEETPSFQKVGARIYDPYDWCKDHKYRSRDYWKCYLRHRTRTGYHSTSTCRMGRVDADGDDGGAVVDPKFKVIGVKSLRVVDASVMPKICNANTMAATYIIGEKAAEIIWNEYQNGGM